jgi:hypothetical protein
MKTSFTTWLADQQDRTDAIGLLAVNYAMDAEDAPRAITVDEVRQRMAEVGAEPAFYDALDDAAKEYEATHYPLERCLEMISSGLPEVSGPGGIYENVRRRR